MRILFYIFRLCLLTSILNSITCSEGDRSPFYQKCVMKCMKQNCTNDGSKFRNEVQNLQDVWSKLFMWSCTDECRYGCMWRTVQGFHERGYGTPKFHGKWPFIRVLGVQEPASAFASVLNLLCHAYMLWELTTKFPIRHNPLALLWCIFGGVCIHAWAWSTIFHTRDNYFTEFMDYACAMSMVMALFISAILRVFHKRRKVCALVMASSALYYVEHVRYLYTGRIDYGYNMLINIILGAAGSLLWLMWACLQYLAGRRYTWRLVVFTILSAAALLLELFDFPPAYNAWDAHALWHLSTVPLPLLFYRFVFDDLQNQSSQKLKI